jgi:hypothetical protein
MTHHRNRNALGAAWNPLAVPPLPIADSITAKQPVFDSADQPTLPSQPNRLRLINAKLARSCPCDGL